VIAANTVGLAAAACGATRLAGADEMNRAVGRDPHRPPYAFGRGRARRLAGRRGATLLPIPRRPIPFKVRIVLA
jgi:hypothetical protein